MERIQRFIEQDDAVQLAAWVHSHPDHLVAMVDGRYNVFDACLIKQSVKCVDMLLNIQVMREWVKTRLDASTDSHKSSFLWTKVFEGPRPLDMLKLLAHHSFPLVWRVPSGPQRGRTLLHMAGWWAFVWCHLADSMGKQSPVSLDAICDSLIQMYNLILSSFDAHGLSPFVGCDSHVLEYTSRHRSLLNACKYLIARGAPIVSSKAQVIHWAVLADNAPLVELIAILDAECERHDTRGRLPSEIAKSYGASECQDFLTNRLVK